MKPLTHIKPLIVLLVILLASCTTESLDHVDLTAPGKAQPIISVEPLSLDFGEYETSLEIRIKNLGNGTLNWWIEEDETWIACSQNCGATSIEDVVEVRALRKEVTPGETTCEGELNIYSDVSGGEDPIEVPVKLCVPELCMTVMGTAYDGTGAVIQGVVINIYRDGVLMCTTDTGEDGNYAITDVPISCTEIEAIYGESIIGPAKLPKPWPPIDPDNQPTITMDFYF